MHNSALRRGPWHHRPNGGGGHRIGGGTDGRQSECHRTGTDIPIHRHPGTVCPARPLKMNVDERGSFTELVHTLNAGQVPINISKPGITKGQHWHNTKFEQFIVVKGHGLIQQRNLNDPDGKVLEWKVSGNKIQAVHMLPGYTHNIINLSETEDLVTVMYCNEVFNPERPDTFFEKVK